MIESSAWLFSSRRHRGPLRPPSFLSRNVGRRSGIDISHSKQNARETHFSERITFTPLGPAINRPQVLYGLRMPR